MPMRSEYLPLCGQQIHVTRWGDPGLPALVMWHGLARVGRDFDTAARHLSQRFHVICPDTLGRGWSSWSDQPDRDYTIPAYVDHAGSLLDALGIGSCAWVGTSMGGLVGLAAAAGPLQGRISRLVLNDVGPELPVPAVERIKAYVTRMPDFPGMAEFEAFMRLAYAPYGPQTDAEWRRMAETSARRRDDGRITVHYDPKVMTVFADSIGGFDAWAVYDAIACPTLVLRGAESDLLTTDIADRMTRRGPRPRLVTVPGCGHAPALNSPEQIGVLEQFLS